MPRQAYSLFSSLDVPGALIADNAWYTFGLQFTITIPAILPSLDAVKFYSPAGAQALPDWIGLCDVSSRSILHGEAPVWSGGVGSGWVQAPFSSPQSLTPGNQYKVAVARTSGVNWAYWYSADHNYWTAGSGKTNGPLHAPNSSNSDGGQNSFSTSTPLYPNQSYLGSNYWIDAVVSVTEAVETGLMGLSSLL